MAVYILLKSDLTIFTWEKVRPIQTLHGSVVGILFEQAASSRGVIQSNQDGLLKFHETVGKSVHGVTIEFESDDCDAR